MTVRELYDKCSKYHATEARHSSHEAVMKLETAPRTKAAPAGGRAKTVQREFPYLRQTKTAAGHLSIDKRNRKYAEAAGLPRIKIHEYRHSHVSLLANEGINIQELARRLGHSNVQETWNTYYHLYPRAEERAVEVLNKIGIGIDKNTENNNLKPM